MNATLESPLQLWVVTTRNEDHPTFHLTGSYVFGRVESGGSAGLGRKVGLDPAPTAHMPRYLGRPG